MFLLAFLILCAMTVPLLGGRIGLLADIQFKRAWVGVSAVLIQTLVLGVFPDLDKTLIAGVHLFTYGLMFFFLVANLSLPGLWLIGLGGACNAAAIAANDGVMPAQPSALDTAGIVHVPGEFSNSAAVADPNLWFLGDVFAMPASWPLANVFSIGDIILIVGAFVLMHRVCRSVAGLWFARLGGWVRGQVPRMELLREHTAYRRLWIAQAISALGTWMYPIAVYSTIVDEGTSASTLAFLLVAEVAPAFLVGLFCGPLIDRFSRKSIMIVGDSARAIAVVSLILTNDPTMLHFYAVAVVLGSGAALHQPAFQAALPNIVPSKLLVPANALIGATLSLAVMVGPPLGAGLVAAFGIEISFIVNGLSFVISAALVAAAVIPRVDFERGENMWHELVEGLRYVTRHVPVMGVLVVVLLITVAAGFKQPFEPLFAIRWLDAGTTGFALMGSAWGIGMVTGAIWATKLDRRLGHGPLLTWSIAVVAAAVVIGAAMPTLAPVLVLWLIGGMANTLGTVAYETLIQEETPDRVRGRVFAAVEAAIQAGILLGLGFSVVADPLLARPGHGHAPAGLAISGLLFGVSAVAAWYLLLRRGAERPAYAGEPVRPALEVRALELRPVGATYSLLRIEALGLSAPPVLLVDDGEQVHRVDALPAPSEGRYGYGIPAGLLALKRPVFAVELPGHGSLELSVPAAT